MGQKDILEKIKGGLIVSCQALEDEPLHSPFIMKKMAKAAMSGGAVAIRANGYDDIKEIKSEVNLPIIGLVKKKYTGFIPYITPTIKEVDRIIQAGAHIVAMDATKLEKPGNLTTGELFHKIKNKYPNTLMMADISTYEEGIEAYKLGFDLVSTTLSGYTDYSTKSSGPDFDLVEKLSKAIDIPLIGEGRIQTPEQTVKALKLGAYAIVVGGAITRPQEITKRFVSYIKRSDALL